MTQKKLYKSVIQVEILSENPIPSWVTLSEIDETITEGDWSGLSSWVTENVELVGKAAADATIAQGSDTAFFNMDDEGNDTDE
jgi:hypothetical protein